MGVQILGHQGLLMTGEPYYPRFINNGYESLKAIKSIQNKQELKDMGVQILGHQGLLMTEIEKLKLKRNVTRGMDTSEMVERDGVSFAAKSGAYGTYSTNTQYLFNM